ncbi:MAG: ATP-dependent RNA helicase HrpA [Planctomycetaceae bacterium TMED240]|nr:ATP-dependent RNA helicase HrpA [Rhodopirellula sp.]OUX05980.1 MAG: ATP-dependent RNA helicase HrpA [Planctomycetaceae bacterium TMED240]
MKFRPQSPSLNAASRPQRTPQNQAPQNDSTANDSTALELTIDNAMRVDQYRLKRAQQRLSVDEYEAQLKKSVDLHATRIAAQPCIEYSDELPISQHRDELIELIRSRQVIVVCGETGSGKSTQLPKILLESGLGRKAMIGHTQPRRLAARSIATRLAEELQTPLGELVGYQVRFGDQTSERSLVKSMTDGILLAETQSDHFLDAYDAIIIDEAHERSLNIDFLLGFLRRLQGKRSDLKIVITSATIDADRFSEHFSDELGPAPIVNVEGRGFPVEMVYLPWEEVVADETRVPDLSQHVIKGIETAGRSGPGDMLVFLPTERDIREVSHRVGSHYHRLGMEKQVDLLPLYARLPQSEQQRIFHPQGGKRRIIFATNVAESSLTVPGIRYVIDSGTARISRYSARSKMQRLPIEPVSRASADQRAGRCGRIGPGVCIRLYSQEDYESRDEFTTPEIRRTNLASVVLQTKTLKLGKLEEFPLLDPPRSEAIREGIRTLFELGALDTKQQLTDIGRQLGRFPVDPRVGRMILAADENGVLPEVLPIAAALEIQDPRDRPPEKKQAADEAHAAFIDSRSDFLSYLRLWRYYEQARSDHSRNKLTRVLRKQFLSPNRMREWSDVYRQLKEMAASAGSHRSKNRRRSIGTIQYSDDQTRIVDDDRYAAIHQSLMTGLLSGIAMAGEKNEYNGAGGLKLFLWPGSGVSNTKPKWVIAGELVETSRQFARTVARIDPAWIEKIAGHLLKRSHQDPHWSTKSGGAFCYENMFLFGLPIVTRRRVPLPPLDSVTARTLMIEHGLVERQLRTTAKFVRYNQAMLDAIEKLAAKTRRRDLVVDSYQIAKFYQSQLPENVCDRGRLEKLDRETITPPWAKGPIETNWLTQWLESTAPSTESGGIYMRPVDVLDLAFETPGENEFPDVLTVGNSKLPLDYHFEPGSERDGVSMTVHQSALSQISDDRLGWLVPGLLQPKLISMIKSLPKRIRRNLVPAADVAKKIANELEPNYGKVPFMETVCAAMSEHADTPIRATDFQAEKMGQQFNMLVQVVDDDGELIAESRQVTELQQQFDDTHSSSNVTQTDPADESWARTSMTDFEIEMLPVEVIRLRGGVQVAQYPGLRIQGDKVATDLFADQATAEVAILNGVTKLYALSERKELRNQVRWLPDLQAIKVKLSGLLKADDLENSLIDLVARIAFVENMPVVRTHDEFNSRRQDRGQRIAIATQDVAAWLGNFAEHTFIVRRELENSRGSERMANVSSDVQQQIDWLIHPRFLSCTPWEWLKHYPRYMKGIAYRLEKVKSGAASRDRSATDTITDLTRRWLMMIPEKEQSPDRQAMSEFRWMIEELRVSMFAQPLGTSIKISPQRCEKLLR